jgi:hypothetical protein
MTDDWRARAWGAMRELARSGRPFTADDLIDRVGDPDPDHQPNARNSAVGSLFREAASQGLIVSDGRVVPSRQRHRKGGAIRIWQGTHA